MKLRSLCAASGFLVLFTAPVHAGAQSASPLSVQASGTALIVEDGLVPGGEVQLRITGSRLSLGAGYQVFTRDGARSEIAFVEPRLRLVKIASAAVYAAGRAGRVRVTETFVFGGGGGLLIALNRRAALDAGAQVYSSDAKTTITQARLGLSLGF